MAAREREGGTAAGRSTTTAATVQVTTQQGVRRSLCGPIDKTWSHGEPYGTGFKCGYCSVKVKGGGVTRLREHLAGIQGNVVPCVNVPLDVREIMLHQAKVQKTRKRLTHEHRIFIEKEVAEAKKGFRSVRATNVPRDEAGQIEMALRESLRDLHGSPLGKAGSSGAASCSATQQTKLDMYLTPSASNCPFDIDLARSRAQVQPRVDIMLQGDARERLGKALSKWFHANDIPGKKADCPYFRSAMKLAQQLGEGVHIPYGREIDGPFLEKNFEDLEEHLAEFRDDWAQYGVTVMCDSWTGPTMMCIINFMIFCNGRMFFHKSVNATGHVQNADFIFDCIKEVIVEEIGVNHIVQLVTDNGSNYKKACKKLADEYPHITWQPCAAHTISLMLKDIGQFPEVMDVVKSAKRICRFLYNHNRLHAMMRERIGGELIRWNATRFGTVFIFLQSFWDKKDKFKEWMISDEWTNSQWRNESDHEFTYDCLTSRQWWNDLELVLKAVTPIYCVLRYADQEKIGSISGFFPRMIKAVDEIRADLDDHQDLLRRITGVVNSRVRYMVNETLMLAAAALDPEGLYRSKIARKSNVKFAVTMALKKLASSPLKASIAIEQFALFSAKRGLFGGEEAKKAALSGRMTAADWWDSFGGQYKELQTLARRIVSQCMSSSGCERNWSTFALVHTKLRNRLGYDKLHKLVYVHYNLKLRVHHFQADLHTFQEMLNLQENEADDPSSILMDVALYDERNPIMDWVSNSMSESQPTLDEYDDNTPETSNPSRFLSDELEIGEDELASVKRKLSSHSKKKSKGKSKLGWEEGSADDSESDSGNNTNYAELSEGNSSEDSEPEGFHDFFVDTEGANKATDQANGTTDAPQCPPKTKRRRTASVRGLYSE